MVTLNARRSIRRNILRTSSHERMEPDTVSLSFRVPPTTVRTGAEGETNISGTSTQQSQVRHNISTLSFLRHRIVRCWVARFGGDADAIVVVLDTRTRRK